LETLKRKEKLVRLKVQSLITKTKGESESKTIRTIDVDVSA